MVRPGILLALCALSGCHIVFGFDNDLSSEDDAGVQPVCSPIRMIANNFEADTSPWAFDRASALVGGGRLLLIPAEPDQNPDSGTYAVADSRHWYDATGQPITFRFGDTGISGESNALVRFSADRPNQSVEVWRTEGELHFTVGAGESPEIVRTLDYSPIDHAFVSVLFQDDNVEFATSSDGDTFTGHVTRLLPGVQFVHMSARAFRAFGEPEVTFFIDDLMGGTPAGVACPANSLTETFTSELGRIWVEDAEMGDARLDNGQLLINVSGGNGDAYYSLRSRRVYNLIDNEVFLEIPQAVDNGTFQLIVRSRTADEVRISQSQGEISAVVQKPGEPATKQYQEDLSPEETRWWKIRNEGGMTSWHVSGDGVQWLQLASTGGVEGLEIVEVEIVLYNNAEFDAEVRVDNINTPP